MASGLSVWRVKNGVYTALQTLIPGELDLVLPGRPVEVPALRTPRRVYVGDVLDDTPVPIWQPGSTIRTEEFILPLLVDCLSLTGNAANGELTAWTLVQAIVTGIEGLIGKDPSWGGTCHSSGLGLAGEATSALADQPGGSGWRSGAILELHVKHKGS
jgi:hypothetical protein